MRHGSLFSGIGGFDLAAQWMGWENIFHCEWNPFGQRVLKYYWPNAKSYEDITQTDFTIHRGCIDILTGGFPCQPYSMAGKRKGKADERHLWPEMLRAIREIAPRYIVGENVLGLVNWDGGLVFDEVQADLESAGYEVAAVVIPAAAVNAPHGRDRVWFVANCKGNRNCGGLRCLEGSHDCQRKSKKHGQDYCESCDNGGEWLTADTASVRGNREEEHEDNYRQGREWGRCNPNNFGKISNGTLTADTESESSERLRPEQQEFSQSEQGKLGRNGGEVGDGLTADTTSTGGGKDNWERKSRFNDKAGAPDDWQNFPTQSPICGGDDGLPTELDGITFSKWRNESIKAYGNAIVPQVAFEIFKVIQQIENTYICPR